MDTLLNAAHSGCYVLGAALEPASYYIPTSNLHVCIPTSVLSAVTGHLANLGICLGEFFTLSDQTNTCSYLDNAFAGQTFFSSLLMSTAISVREDSVHVLQHSVFILQQGVWSKNWSLWEGGGYLPLQRPKRNLYMGGSLQV